MNYRLLISVSIFFLYFQSRGQVNFVPNPSFEDHRCNIHITDTSSTNFLAVNYWFNANLNQFGLNSICSSTPEYGVPINNVGFQMPKSGDSYIHLVTVSKKLDAIPANDSRSFPSCKLKETLQANHYYKISFFISLSSIQYHSPSAIVG